MRQEVPSLEPHTAIVSKEEMDAIDLTLHRPQAVLPRHLTVLVLTSFPRYELVNLVNITPTNPRGVNDQYGVFYEIVGLPYSQSSVKVEHAQLSAKMEELRKTPDRQIAAVIAGSSIPSVGYVRHTCMEALGNGALLDAIATKYALQLIRQ